MSLEIIMEDEEVSSDLNEEKPACRFCLDDEFQEDLFVPCRCSGTARYVHKRCLQEWRSQDIHSLNYTRCQECLYEYEMTNNISNVLSCWIRICKTLSQHYFFIFFIILGEFTGIYFLVSKYDPNGSMASALHLSLSSGNEQIFISFALTVIPLFIFILMHDLYIFFRYRLHTYFDNYAGIGMKATFIALCFCIIFLSVVWPVLSLILVSILFQKIFKHMLARHYYRHVTESSDIIDQRNNEELQIVVR
jgi:hypothetical protein